MDIPNEDAVALRDYQGTTHATAIYPEEHALGYLFIGLLAEVAEFVNAESSDIAIAEVGDILWFLSELANLINVDLFTLLVIEEPNWSPPLSADVVSAGVIISEIADAANYVAKHLRDGSSYEIKLQLCLQRAVQTVYSMVDIMEGKTGVSFKQLLDSNAEKLQSRQKRGVLGGSGNKR